MWGDRISCGSGEASRVGRRDCSTRIAVHDSVRRQDVEHQLGFNASERFLFAYSCPISVSARPPCIALISANYSVPAQSLEDPNSCTILQEIYHDWIVSAPVIERMRRWCPADIEGDGEKRWRRGSRGDMSWSGRMKLE